MAPHSSMISVSTQCKHYLLHLTHATLVFRPSFDLHVHLVPQSHILSIFTLSSYHQVTSYFQPTLWIHEAIVFSITFLDCIPSLLDVFVQIPFSLDMKSNSVIKPPIIIFLWLEIHINLIHIHVIFQILSITVIWLFSCSFDSMVFHYIWACHHSETNTIAYDHVFSTFVPWLAISSYYHYCWYSFFIPPNTIA